MMKLKLRQKLIAQAIGFAACSLSSLLVWQAIVVAAPVVFTPPAGGAPRETKGGAARGDALCVRSVEGTPQKLVLLAPAISDRVLTTLERPTFLIYVPPTSAEKALFSLKNAKGQTHYRTTLSVPQQGGVMRITLPSEAAPLAVNQSYEWGFALLCAGKLRPDSPSVSSTVQRIQLSPEVVAKLSAQSPLQQAGIYGANGVWYDMIATIASLKKEQPQNQTLKETWNQLLSSAGLDAIVSAPVNN